MTNPTEATARSIMCSLNVRVAWWLMPYLRTLAILCKLTGMRPNMNRVNRLIDKAITVAPVRLPQ